MIEKTPSRTNLVWSFEKEGKKTPKKVKSLQEKGKMDVRCVSTQDLWGRVR